MSVAELSGESLTPRAECNSPPSARRRCSSNQACSHRTRSASPSGSSQRAAAFSPAHASITTAATATHAAIRPMFRHNPSLTRFQLAVTRPEQRASLRSADAAGRRRSAHCSRVPIFRSTERAPMFALALVMEVPPVGEPAFSMRDSAVTPAGDHLHGAKPGKECPRLTAEDSIGWGQEGYAAFAADALTGSARPLYQDRRFRMSSESPRRRPGRRNVPPRRICVLSLPSLPRINRPIADLPCASCEPNYTSVSFPWEIPMYGFSASRIESQRLAAP